MVILRMNGRNIKTLYAAHRVHLRVAYGSQNKQQLFLSTTAADWLL